jgi:DNA-binding transcriptional MerR regulator
MNCTESYHVRFYQQKGLLIEEQSVNETNLLYTTAYDILN